jgi:hypothetical protein
MSQKKTPTLAGPIHALYSIRFSEEIPSLLKRLRIVYEAHAVQPRQLEELVAMHAQALRKVRVWYHHLLALLQQ